MCTFGEIRKVSVHIQTEAKNVVTEKRKKYIPNNSFATDRWETSSMTWTNNSTNFIQISSNKI